MSSKSDPRSSRTLSQIEDAFLDLHRSHAIDDITITEIARTAGINRATFYNYFEDKYALYDYTIETRFQVLLDEHVSSSDVLTKATFTALVHATILFIRERQADHNIIAERYDMMVQTRVQKIVFDRIMRWIEPNYLKGPCQSGTEVVATAVSWAVFGVAIRLTEQKVEVAIDEVSEELVRLLADGLWSTLVGYHEELVAQHQSIS